MLFQVLDYTKDIVNNIFNMLFQVLQVLDYTTDICYNICADALGGVVKSR